MNNPKIHESVFVADSSTVLGDVTIGSECGVWFNAVIRGDKDSIVIGNRTNVQDGAVLHIDAGFPMTIGDNVTIGHNAIVHGATIGSNVIIGMGAIIMNGAVIGDNCIIGAGSLVPGGKEIPSGSVAFGNPAKVRSEVDEKGMALIKQSADVYVEEAAEFRNK